MIICTHRRRLEDSSTMKVGVIERFRTLSELQTIEQAGRHRGESWGDPLLDDAGEGYARGTAEAATGEFFLLHCFIDGVRFGSLDWDRVTSVLRPYNDRALFCIATKSMWWSGLGRFSGEGS